MSDLKIWALFLCKKKRCEICLNLTVKRPERRQWQLALTLNKKLFAGSLWNQIGKLTAVWYFFVNFEHISHLFFALFLLLTLNICVLG